MIAPPTCFTTFAGMGCSRCGGYDTACRRVERPQLFLFPLFRLQESATATSGLLLPPARGTG